MVGLCRPRWHVCPAYARPNETNKALKFEYLIRRHIVPPRPPARLPNSARGAASAQLAPGLARLLAPLNRLTLVVSLFTTT